MPTSSLEWLSASYSDLSRQVDAWPFAFLSCGAATLKAEQSGNSSLTPLIALVEKHERKGDGGRQVNRFWMRRGGNEECQGKTVVCPQLFLT